MRPALLAVLLLLGGCIHPAVEEHGGVAPRPSRMPDAGFVAIGSAFDAGLLAARVPWAVRLPLDACVAAALRNLCVGTNCRYFGRSVDSHFLFLVGVFPPEWLHSLLHAVHR